MRLGHQLTDTDDSPETGARSRYASSLAANILPNQIPYNKTEDKTQRKENVRGSKGVTETTVEPNVGVFQLRL